MKRVFIFALFFVGMVYGTTAQNRWYVDSSGSSTGMGTSWVTACSDLQLVINNASAGDTIWAAKGTYKPLRRADNLGTISLNNRDNAFVLKANVHIYGGFTGSETSLSQRNWNAYPTVLSGDIGIVNDTADNCYHVVISAGDTASVGTLDGFTITGGNASDNSLSITVNGAIIPKSDGGGICIVHSSPTLKNLVVCHNLAVQSGGGIYIGNYMGGTPSPKLINLIIDHNEAVRGGGISNGSASPILINVIIKENTATSSGGGIWSHSICFPVLTNVLVIKNKAKYGGGICNGNISLPILTNVTISGNVAEITGGGMFHDYKTWYSPSSSRSEIRNTIIWGNTAGANMENNVVDTNFIPSLHTLENITAYFNCLIGGKPTGNGIILNKTPLFVDPANNDYRLSPCSPAIDAGNNAFYSPDSLPNLFNITMDLDNNPRFYDSGIIDLGAYEYQGTPVSPPSATMGNDTTICYGESADIIFSVTGTPNWDIVYTKDNGTTYDTLNVTASPYILQDNYTESTTYQLQSISSHICHGVSLSGEKSITVLPEATLDNILSNDTLCDGQQTTPVAFTGIANQFQWTALGGVQGIPSGTQTGDFGTYTVENKTSSPTTSAIRVIPVSTQGGLTCEGLPHSFAIIATPATTIQSFTSNSSIFCEGEELEMTLSATGYLLSYQWYHNGSALNGQTRNTYNVPGLSSSQSGQYYVKIKSSCGEQISNTLNIRIDKDSVLVEKWDDVLLVDNSTEDYIGYQWYKDGIMIPGATNQFYQELGGLNGCYKVNLTLKSEKKEMTCERCLDNVKKSLSIYPNPVKQGKSVNISLYDENQLYQGLMETRLYSTDGKLLQKKQVDSGNSEVNISNLAVGVYILKITTEDGQSYNEKIMVY